MHRIILGLCLALACCLFSCQSDLPAPVKVAMETLPQEVDFNLHVKPILSDRCFACHGPDEKARKAELRLDIEEEAFAVLENNKVAFSKHNLKKSEAIQRILSEDSEVQMPPPQLQSCIK